MAACFCGKFPGLLFRFSGALWCEDGCLHVRLAAGRQCCNYLGLFLVVSFRGWSFWVFVLCFCGRMTQLWRWCLCDFFSLGVVCGFWGGLLVELLVVLLCWIPVCVCHLGNWKLFVCAYDLTVRRALFDEGYIAPIQHWCIPTRHDSFGRLSSSWCSWTCA